MSSVAVAGADYEGVFTDEMFDEGQQVRHPYYRTKFQSEAIVREQPMDGQRTDHMALSPDGRRLLVSDSTQRQVIEFSMVDETAPDGTPIRMGDRLRTFASGETPHESIHVLLRPQGRRNLRVRLICS